MYQSPFKKWLYRMDYKYGRHAIQNLMLVITVGMIIVILGGIINPGIENYFTLYRPAIFTGEIWRLVTFIFVPIESSNLIFTLIGIYFYYFIGSTLENTWGTFKFNIYYLCGVIGLIVSALITGYADNFYLNMSLFFAFAALYPENKVLLFYIIPIKIKWLGMLNAILFLFNLIFGSIQTKASIITVLVVFLLFFWSDITSVFKNMFKYNKTRSNFKKNYKPNGDNTINFKK